MKRTYLTFPESFSFESTLSLIRRSEDDPANQIIDNCWYKVITLDNEKPLIATIKPGKCLLVEASTTNAKESKELKTKLAKLLGLDDPLPAQISTLNLAQKHEQAILSYLSAYLPSYTHLFEGIVQTVLGQQIAVSAANQARKNFVTTFGESVKVNNQTHYAYPTAKQFLSSKTDERFEQLLAMKLSRTKAKAIIESAEWLLSIDEGRLNLLDNEPLQTALTAIHGIGQWTSDWLLLKYFRRFEIIPAGDLAVRKAFTWWLNKPELLSKEAVMKLAKKYHPFGGLLAQRVLCAYQGHGKK